MSELTHKELAELPVRLQGTAASRGRVHGVGDPSCQNPSSQRLAVHRILSIWGGDYECQRGRFGELAIGASHIGFHHHHINYSHINHSDFVSRIPPENERYLE